MKAMMDAGSANPSVAAPRARPLSIRAPRAPAGAEWMDDSAAAGEPVSPSARLMEGINIVVALGFGAPVNLPVFRAGIEANLAPYPRFQSIQVTDHGFKDGKLRWMRTTVNVDNHIIIPVLDPAAIATDPDKAVEDYMASLSTLPMDPSRPLWDFHILDFPTSEATSTVALRANHSLADGTSLITLLMASTRSAANPASLPAMPPPPKRTGAIYAPPRPPRSAGALALLAWVWSYFVLAWHTVVDVVFFIATVLFLRDPQTLFRRADDGGFHHTRRRRFVHRSLGLDDVKCIKNAMNCTVNDVLVGVTSAALSRYYFRKSGDTSTRKTCLRSVVVVNTRPTNSLQKYVQMVQSGNQLGYIILPFHIALRCDALEYVRKSKEIMDRKKSSLEVIFTHMLAEIFLRIFGVKAGAFVLNRMLANTTIAFSNMVGPIEQVEFYGHPVAFIAPSVYGPPEALIVHYQSYNNIMKVVLSVDDELLPDYCQLLEDFAVSLDLMKDAASRTTKQ